MSYRKQKLGRVLEYLAFVFHTKPANQYRSVCGVGTTVDYRKTVSGPAATESPWLRTCELMDRGLLRALAWQVLERLCLKTV
jgi:hypothetical protein